MEITVCNTLAPAQKNEITALENQAFQREGLSYHSFLSNEINFDTAIPCFYLAREDGQLVGFLTTFLPTRQDAEISAVTHPAFQRRGIFTALLHTAQAQLRRWGVPMQLFCVEPGAQAAHKVLPALGVSQLDRSEYRMQLHRADALPTLPPDEHLHLEKACPGNQSDFARITQQAFGEQEDDATISTAITSDTRRGYLLYRDQTPLGVFVLGLEDDVFLYGVAMDAAWRGKGYGKYLLAQALALGLKKGKPIVLDVDSNNPVAFHLYQKLGFVITFQVDYYRKAL